MDSSIKIEGATPIQLKTWNYIRDKQVKPERLQAISKLWNSGYEHMQGLLSKPTVFEDISIPHWRVLPIDGKSDDLVFFDRLSKGIFNANIYMRDWGERDYLPTRCRWHDSFGHLPYLYDDQYSHILRQIGMMCKMVIQRYPDDLKVQKTYIEWISRLYWYTIEFGLIAEDNKVKAFGAGIISSPGELTHTILSEVAVHKFREFNLDEVVERDFEVYDFQHTYFIIRSLDQIQDALIELYKRIF